MDIEIEKTIHNLIKTNEALNNFASIVSYDLKAPLNKILEQSKKLRTKCKNKLDTQSLNFISDIENTSLQMKKLIEQIHNLSFIGLSEIETQETKLSEVIDQVSAELKKELEENSAQLQIIGNPPVINGNQDLLIQLFKHLVNNAIRFRQPNLSLVIQMEISMSEDLVKIAIKDNGIGFKDDDADKIYKQFEAYGKADEYLGISIGLAVCNMIVQKHNGSMFAKSVPGKGSVFTVLLPC